MEVGHLEEGSNQDNNDVRLLLVKTGKEPKTAAANGKPTNGKMLLASTKLVQDELLPGSSEAKSLENSSNQDSNNIGLPLVKAGQRLKTATANEKPACGKLLSVSTKLALKIGQNVKAKKVLILKTG